MTTQASPKQSLSLRVKLTLRLLEKIKHGTLRLTLPDGQTLQFGKDEASLLAAELHIKDVAMFEAVLELGDIGFGETYMEGLWDTPDLGALMQLLAANRQSLEKVVYGHWWSGLWQRLRHALNRNTRAGSRRNIAAHYDLGNDFYELWLDPSMTYSSALFKGNFNPSLQEAQMAKCHQALSSAGVRPGSRVLEVGCGWGGLAALSIEHFGAYHTGITLSREQLEWVKARQAESHESGRLQLQFRDYRELLAPDEAPYDAIVSIEMFEAVGQAYWAEYMAMLARSLRVGGKACIQTITIDEALFERYASGTDFIQKHVFPGGMLPSAKRFVEHAQKAGLELVDHLAFGHDYAETLRRWRHSFEASLDKVRAQGYDERFIRLWRFYLTYCEAGFDQGSLNVEQFTLCHAQAS